MTDTGRDGVREAIHRILMDELEIETPNSGPRISSDSMVDATNRILASLENTPAQAEGEEGKAKPVMIQSRMRPTFDKTASWSTWVECTEAHAASLERFPDQTSDEWEYQVRRLYTAPPAPDADALRAEVKRLATEWKIERIHSEGLSRTGQALKARAEAAEARAATAEAEVERLRAGVTPLIEACYDEMHGPVCEYEPDDEHVASTLDDSGKVVPAGRITFGMIRRARSAISPAQARNADQSRQETPHDAG